MIRSVLFQSVKRLHPAYAVTVYRQQVSVLNFRRNLSDELRSKFEKAVKENDVVVFMKGTKESPMCGFSRAVVAIMYAEGLENFHTINVLADEEVRQGIKEFSSWPTIPQVYIKGDFIGGCDIMVEMHKNEELRKLLLENKIISE